MHAEHLQHRRPQAPHGWTHTTVDVFPSTIAVSTEWEELNSVYVGPIRTTQSIARCRNAIAALEQTIEKLKDRSIRLDLDD